MAKKSVTNKAPVPKQLFSVAWVPVLENKPLTQDEILEVGGRIIDTRLSKSGAEEVERVLTVGTEGNGLGGEYIAIQMEGTNCGETS